MKFLDALVTNLVFFTQFLGIVAIIFLIAYLLERLQNKQIAYTGKLLTTKKLTMIGLFSAISTILMMFEIPLPFTPPFYKIDISEVPVLIITFSFGPLAGILTEFCKILLKLVFRSTSTAFVGELANFIIGAGLVLPAGCIYLWKKDRKTAYIACICATICMTIVGSFLNAVYLLPTFAKLYGMEIEAIVAMGNAINPNINSVSTMVLLAVVPFNIIKGVVVSFITLLLYKKLSSVIK